MIKELKDEIGFFLFNKKYMLLMLLAVIGGYLYVFTHGTCGIDDISIDLYFDVGIGVAIGRWPYYLVNKIIPITEYTPFIADFITVVLMVAAAIGWCVLIRKILGEELPIWAYIVFSIWFIDYSMNADVFVFYLQNGLGWLHLFVVISLMLVVDLYKGKHKIGMQLCYRISIIIMLTLAISFYESAANLFVTGALALIFIDLWRNDEKALFRNKYFFQSLFFVARYLVYAMICRRIMRTLIMRVFGILPYTFYRSVSSLEWITKGGVGRIGENIGNFFANIFCNYFAVGVAYYPIFIFSICSVIYLVALAYITYKKKDVLLFLSGCGLYISLYLLSAISGEPMQYRACQNFVLFVALIFGGLAGYAVQKKGALRAGLCIGITWTILYSIYDMNEWFILDYEKTEYEMQVIDEIAKELKSGAYDIDDKPIVFVGDFGLPVEIAERYLITQDDFGWEVVKAAVIHANGSEEKVKYGTYCYSQNSSSIIDWSVRAFAMYAGYNVPIRQLFEYREHDFIWANSEIVKQVFELYYPLDSELYSYTGLENYEENYGDSPQYPTDGYIEELEDCIVIRL